MQLIGRNSDTMIFSSRTRLVGWVWFGIGVSLAAVVGTQVRGADAYLIAWPLLSGLFTLPALATSLHASRMPDQDRRFWQLWASAVALMILVGTTMLAAVTTGIMLLHHLAGAGVVAVILTLSVALIRMLRSRSGLRALGVDVVETAMLLVTVVAFAPLAFHNWTISSEASYFWVPSAAASVALVAAFCWALALYRPLKGQTRLLEGMGVALAAVAAADAIAQAAQGLTMFALPAAPLLTLQALTMGLLFLAPLYLTRTPPTGLDRLPPEAQIRTTSLAALAVLLLLPLGALAFVLHETVTWAIPYFAAVTVGLLLLATLRGHLVQHETQRLYARVEAAAEERRQLLADVIGGVDHDRHRVAAQLHEQATSLYVAFSSYLRSSTEHAEDLPPSMVVAREDLAAQAESLRQLMLAVRPLETSDRAPGNLSTTIAAYVDSLYRDGVAPSLVISIDPDLELDWATETVAFRILQEALRNVWLHSEATHVSVAIGYDDDAITLRVRDDGVGFHAASLVFESGLASMRNIAALAEGKMTVESEPGAGTTVVARLRTGGSLTTETPIAPVRPGLRVIRGGLTDGPDEHASDEAGTPEVEPDVAAPAAVNATTTARARGVLTRLSERRASSNGRHYFRFKFTPDAPTVGSTLVTVAAGYLCVPIVMLAAFAVDARADTLTWIGIAAALLSLVALSNLLDFRRFRRAEWEKFDPRIAFVQLTLAFLGAGALGIALDGQAALFMPALVIILLIGSVLASRLMLGALWLISVAVLAGVLASTGSMGGGAPWVVAIYAVVAALMVTIVDLVVGRLRDLVDTMEGVADFASVASSVRSWEDDDHDLVDRLAATIDADHLILYERPHRAFGDLRVLGSWSAEHPRSPMADDSLLAVAELTTSAGDLVDLPRHEGHVHHRAISASTSVSNIVLAVQCTGSLAQLDDAALIAGVSLVATVVERGRLIDDLVGEARTDSLTGLANRRPLAELMAHEMRRATRTGQPLSFAMLDLDHFKDFNDTRGHAAGDEALRRFAHRLTGRIRAQDVAARYGGEEFCVLFPDTSAEDAARVLADLRLQLASDDATGVTFSAGVAEWEPGESDTTLIARADDALYGAKEAGRDRTHRADELRLHSTCVDT